MNIKEYLDILKDLWTPTNASKIRMAISNALEMMGNNLKENIDRQDNVENQFQDVLDETTGKDVINGPEIIAARNGEANLKARLDNEQQEVTTQLAHDVEYSSKSTYNYLSSGKKEKKVVVSFIADDAPKKDLTKLLPIMQEKQIPVGIGVVTDYVGKTINNESYNNEEFMSWEDLRLMQKNGAEIMAHSHTHANMTEISEKEREREMGLCHKILSEKGFVVDGFIYPYNAFNGETIKTAKKHYKYSFARHTSNSPRIDNNKINRHSLGSFYDVPNQSPLGLDTSSLAYYKERVDIANQNDDWLVFVLHTYGDNFNETQQQHFREIIDYIRALGVDIVSPREGFERFGNIVQIDDSLTINSSGVVEKTHIHNRYVLTHDVTFATTPSNYGFKLIGFNWAEYQDSKFIVRNPTHERFEVTGAGLYLIEYSLLVDLEEGANLTVSLFTQTRTKRGTTPYSSKSESFVIGTGLINPNTGKLKPLPLNGQLVIRFAPDNAIGFNCYLQLDIKGQSGTYTNKIIGYQDLSRISITKL